MPKRPRQHVIEDLARARLHTVFSSAGWTVEDLDKDYGEDLFVRIFEDGSATPWAFFVQSKATDDASRLLAKDGRNMAVRITSKHAQHWERFWEPVVLAVYDTKADLTHWEVIQDCLKPRRGPRLASSCKSLTVRIPTDNILDEDGLRRLRNRTRHRFERFAAQKEGAQVLIDELCRQWGIEIEYEPELGMLILPQGSFERHKSGGYTVTAFGRCAAMLRETSKAHGGNPQRAFEAAIDAMLRITSAFLNGSRVQLRDRHGDILQQWGSYEEMKRSIDRQIDLDNDV